MLCERFATCQRGFQARGGNRPPLCLSLPSPPPPPEDLLLPLHLPAGAQQPRQAGKPQAAGSPRCPAVSRGAAAPHPRPHRHNLFT